MEFAPFEQAAVPKLHGVYSAAFTAYEATPKDKVAVGVCNSSLHNLIIIIIIIIIIILIFHRKCAKLWLRC